MSDIICDPKKIRIDSKYYKIGSIIDMIDNNKLSLIPQFIEYNNRWDHIKQSRYIESIFLGIPLADIYLAEFSNGRYYVVDGLQRLQSIYNFCKESYKLTDLEYLIECNGKNCSQSQEITFFYMECIYIKFNIIKYETPMGFKNNLYERLNKRLSK